MASSLLDSDVSVISHFLAGGEMVPAQMPTPSHWSPEKKLAAAVLTAALVEVRDRHDQPHYRRRVQEDLRWIMSDDVDWPFSFLRLCQIFGLEPEYVRNVVRRWQNRSSVRRQVSLHRHAA